MSAVHPNFDLFNNADRNNALASIAAHNLDDRYSGSPTQFVGRLTGTDAYDTQDIDKIIKLKTINPNLPIYIQMRHGEVDEHGVRHGCHALRVKHIIPKPPSYEFVLVNPWNNQGASEHYSLEEIKGRRYRFSVYSTNKNDYAVTQALLACPREQGKYVFANPSLLNIFIEMQKRKWALPPQQIAVFIKLHQKMPYLHLLFNSLSAMDQEKMLRGVIDKEGQQERFLRWAISNFPNLGFIKIILEQNTDHDCLNGVFAQLALIAQRDPGLHAVFSDPDFFNLVLHTAIQHKKAHLADTMESAKEEIELGLIHHFLESKERFPTRNSGLRALIYAKIFTETTVKAAVRPEMLLAHSIAHLIKNDSVPVPVRELIRQPDGAVINDAFLKILLNSLACRNPRELFVGIKKISDLNPGLAKALFSLIAPKTEDIFRVPYAKVIEEIHLEPHAVKEWFFAMPQPLDGPSKQELVALERAANVIKAFVAQITSFEVPLNNGKSTEEIEKQQKELITHLEEIIKDKLLQEAYGTLGIIDAPQLIKALAEKKMVIRGVVE